MSMGRAFTSPKNTPPQATSTSSTTTKTTPYPKGLGLDSPWVLFGAAVLVGCWLPVVAVVVAAVGCCCCCCCFWWWFSPCCWQWSFCLWRWGYRMLLLLLLLLLAVLLAMLLAISGPGKAGGISRRLINIWTIKILYFCKTNSLSYHIYRIYHLHCHLHLHQSRHLTLTRSKLAARRFQWTHCHLHPTAWRDGQLRCRRVPYLFVTASAVSWRGGFEKTGDFAYRISQVCSFHE